ncbi:hypothetical protein [Desulfovibrio sp. UIB00]|uniref:hypothetical protein n=1 Tax=Desulfovibrio sp. UIB00 TaxID=2804314 RepID=UPI001F0F1E63|nr:hypothetical protein [Desulfovibrio sp. UIB00]MCH5146011.1 hypothetical protein [Desulfovibrio sp. UIB00]
MINYFDDEDKRHWPWRAVQVWQILVSKAVNKQLMTYGELANILGFEGARVLAHPLGHIAVYCKKNGLPPLTSLVVNVGGSPGDGFPDKEKYSPLDEARFRVFTLEWYKIVPPTAEEYAELGSGFEKAN